MEQRGECGGAVGLLPLTTGRGEHDQVLRICHGYDATFAYWFHRDEAGGWRLVAPGRAIPVGGGADPEVSAHRAAGEILVSYRMRGGSGTGY